MLASAGCQINHPVLRLKSFDFLQWGRRYKTMRWRYFWIYNPNNLKPKAPDEVFNAYKYFKRTKEPCRKAVWLPTAPSKYYKVYEPPNFSPIEKKAIQRMEYNYDILRNSLCAYFKEKFYLPTLEAGGMPFEIVKTEEEEFEKLLRENEETNAKIAKEREARLQREADYRDEELIKEEMAYEAEEAEKGRKIDIYIGKELERSKTFIMQETLEDAINEALAKPVSYNFAIDNKGNIYSDGSLHPYALTPSAIPETSNIGAEFSQTLDKKFKLKHHAEYDEFTVAHKMPPIPRAPVARRRRRN